MHRSNRDVLGFSKRVSGLLSIGQSLREEYVYEVHGPFMADTPARSPRPFWRRQTDRLSALMSRLADRRRPRGIIVRNRSR